MSEILPNPSDDLSSLPWQPVDRWQPWGETLAGQLLSLHPQTAVGQANALRQWIQQLGERLSEGDTCLMLPEHSSPGGEVAELQPGQEFSAALPATLNHPLIVVAEHALQRPAPLVMDQGHLYFWRQWHEEQALSTQLLQLARAPLATVQLHADQHVSDPHQNQALLQAALHPVSLITGGPGTGKTYTLVRIVKALLQAQPTLRIALAAPTGKAAQRMKEALNKEFQHLDIATDTIQEAITVHRLLGMGTGEPRYHRDNPLPFDLVVIDECSMLDLALSCRLMDALSVGTRLILLGDANQLAAVDAGAVLADLNASPALAAFRTELHTSVRFTADSAIGQLATAVLQQAPLAALQEILESASEIRFQPLDKDTAPAQYRQLWAGYAPLVSALQATTEAYRQAEGEEQHAIAHQLLPALDHYRVLAAQRRGPFGVERLNAAMGAKMAAAMGETSVSRMPWFHGRIVMMTRNDYRLQVSNGDVGLCLRDRLGQPQVYFPHLALPIAASRLGLDQVDSAFAMTIHKSQGSEFDHIAMVLDGQEPIALDASPSGTPARSLLSRELVYTALTRAKKTVAIYSQWPTLAQAIARKGQRTTGLQVHLMRAAKAIDFSITLTE